MPSAPPTALRRAPLAARSPRPWMVAGLLWVAFAATGSGGPDARGTGRASQSGGGGCGGGLHAAAAAGGAGVVGIRACSELGSTGVTSAARFGDDAVRLGARGTDDVGGLGRLAGGALDAVDSLAWHGGEASATLARTADAGWAEAAALVGQGALDEGLDLSHLGAVAARHPGAVGLRGDALASYAAAHPDLWQDVGVELFLSRPDRWAALGGDELLDLALDASPLLRTQLAEASTPRFREAIQRAADGASSADVEAATGVTWRRDGARIVFDLVLDGAQLTLDVFDTQLTATAEELAAGRRAPDVTVEAPEWTSSEALLACLRATDDPCASAPHLSVGRFHALRVGESFAWFGPDGEGLASGSPDTSRRLLGYLGAGRGPIAPEAMAALWPAIARGVQAGPLDPSVQPTATATGDGVRYAATYVGGTTLDLLVAPDGSVVDQASTAH